MFDLLIDALIDSAKMLPWLFFIYILMEWLETHFDESAQRRIQKAKRAGPVVGALLGCLPQCGFSVMATGLYSRRILTLGTLLAVYLSTSDEAIPILLANPDQYGTLAKLLVCKIILAVTAGYLIDFFTKRYQKGRENNTVINLQERKHAHCSCGHTSRVRQFLISPLLHALKITAFIFAVSIALNIAIHYIGEENLSSILLSGTIFQPLLVGLVGLIPNCASSVIITEVFLQGGISFGSAIAGMSTAAGFGIIVLFTENKNGKENLLILSLLYGISCISGIIIQCFG